MGDFPVKLLKKQSKHMDSKSSNIYYILRWDYIQKEP